MASEIYDAFRAILTQDDPSLARVFDSLPAGPDLFELVDSGKLTARHALLYDDRDGVPGRPSLRRWRPTLVLSAPPELMRLRAGEGEVFVLSDASWPVGVSAVPADLVVTDAPAELLAECQPAVGLFRSLAYFVSGVESLTNQGAPEQAVTHPQMRECAHVIAEAGLRFGAVYREGITAPVGLLAPPAGARQISPERWLTRDPAGTVDAPPFTMAPIRAPLIRPSGAGLAD